MVKKKKTYKIIKNKYDNQKIDISNRKINGLKFIPKNKVKYDGIKVDSMLVIKPSFIEKILDRKNKRKLDYFLSYIINILDDENGEDTDVGSLNEVLNDLTRYKDIVEYKYRQYLDDRYIDLLLKKVSLLEHELKTKIVYKTLQQNYQYEPVKEEVRGKSR